MARNYPGIARAALEITLDNGGINIRRSVEQQERDRDKWLAAQPEDLVRPIDEWLAGLSDDDLRAVCSGGQDEPEQLALLAAAPPFTDDLLNDYFEKVC